MSEKPEGLIPFAGRVAIITGAASGIGRAMAKTFAAAGAKLLLTDIKDADLAETLDQVTRAGGDAVSCIADVALEESASRCVALAQEQWGGIDILCNNAGIMDDMAPAGEVDTAMWNRVLAVNLTGPFLMSRAVLPHMVARGGGAIVNIASLSSLRGGSAGAAYTSSKHGVVGLTKNIAWTYAADGIRCNAICPGAVATNIMEGKTLADLNPAGVTRLAPVLQLSPKVAGPQAIADVALFLASDASVFINGAIVPVDGGWIAG